MLANVSGRIRNVGDVVGGGVKIYDDTCETIIYLWGLWGGRVMGGKGGSLQIIH